MNTPLTPISENQIAQLMTTPYPFVILFSATWCGKCQITESMLFKLQSTSDQSVSIYKIMTEAESSFNRSLGVHRLPTLVFVKNGQVMHNISGIMARQDIQKHMTELMNTPSDN